MLSRLNKLDLCGLFFNQTMVQVRLSFSKKKSPHESRSFRRESNTKLPILHSLIHLNTDVCQSLREGFQKKRQIIHILWISVLLPPPLSTWAKVNNIHTKEFFYPHFLIPPPSALIHVYRYYFFFFLFSIYDFFQFFS